MQLFLGLDEKEDRLDRKVKMLEEQCEKVRKSLYARNNQLEKRLCDAMQRLDNIERNICQQDVMCSYDNYVA